MDATRTEPWPGQRCRRLGPSSVPADSIGTVDSGSRSPRRHRRPHEPRPQWVDPDAEGACPASHPLKAKDSSKIVHQPGGLSYDRTHADRCYVDLTAAEADGYRAAKR